MQTPSLAGFAPRRVAPLALAWLWNDTPTSTLIVKYLVRSLTHDRHPLSTSSCHVQVPGIIAEEYTVT